MSNKRTKGLVKHSKTQPLTKPILLEKLCDEEQLVLLRRLESEGCAFIILGGQYTNTAEFQKGVMQLMYQPTSNGVAIYDTYYKYKDNFERPVVTIGLNDTSNTHISRIDNIKVLGRYRSRTLYTKKYEGDKRC